MMEQRRVTSWWAQWTCVGGTCAPPAAPPRTGIERLFDSYTRLTAPLLRGCYALVVVAAVALISLWLSGPAGLWVTAGYMAAYAAYCLAKLCPLPRGPLRRHRHRLVGSRAGGRGGCSHGPPDTERGLAGLRPGRARRPWIRGDLEIGPRDERAQAVTLVVAG